MDIFVDWGSTNFHAFLVEGGQVTERREVAGRGILKSFVQMPPAARTEHYSQFLQQALEPWLERHPEAPILMCGAVGSREGWVETKYVEAPAGPAEVAAGCTHLTAKQRGCLGRRPHRGDVRAGARASRRPPRRDAQRGGEGPRRRAPRRPRQRAAVHPRHACKWLNVEHASIVDFHTVMTGDLYALLCEHGSLAPLFQAAAATANEGHGLAAFDRASIWRKPAGTC